MSRNKPILLVQAILYFNAAYGALNVLLMGGMVLSLGTMKSITDPVPVTNLDSANILSAVAYVSSEILWSAAFILSALVLGLAADFGSKLPGPGLKYLRLLKYAVALATVVMLVSKLALRPIDYVMKEWMNVILAPYMDDFASSWHDALYGSIQTLTQVIGSLDMVSIGFTPMAGVLLTILIGGVERSLDDNSEMRAELNTVV